MRAKYILSALLSFMIPMTSFAVDSTGVLTVSSTNPGKGDSYLLGIGTFLGLYNSPGGPWTKLTQNYTQSSNGTPTIDWKPIQNKNMCDSGFYPVVTYSLMKGNTGGTNDTSVAIVADLCFRISSDEIQIFPINLLNKRPSGSSDRYAAINFTITCVRCTNCSSTYIVFPQPYNNSSGKPAPYDCASLK